MGDFREMRRKRQQLSNDESIAILEKATAGTLALLGDDDYPYAVPISYVYHEGKLFFHSALAGHKVDAIRKYEKASFCVMKITGSVLVIILLTSELLQTKRPSAGTAV